MTLPPVVSDPEVCPERPLAATGGLTPPHDYRDTNVYGLQMTTWLIPVCRFCGGRKP